MMPAQQSLKPKENNMDTSIIITGIIGLGAGLTLGGLFWGHHSDTVKAQAEEIDALSLNNLRLRGQAAELATMAHEAQADAHASKGVEEMTERLMQQAESMLAGEIDDHRATRRKLAAAKGQITKLRKAQ
jgi:hypothetical protein